MLYTIGIFYGLYLTVLVIVLISYEPVSRSKINIITGMVISTCLIDKLNFSRGTKQPPFSIQKSEVYMTNR